MATIYADDVSTPTRLSDTADTSFGRPVGVVGAWLDNYETNQSGAYAFVTGENDTAIQAFLVDRDGQVTPDTALDLGFTPGRIAATGGSNGGKRLVISDPTGDRLVVYDAELTETGIEYTLMAEIVDGLNGVTSLNEVTHLETTYIYEGGYTPTHVAIATSKGDDAISVISLSDATMGDELDSWTGGWTGAAQSRVFEYAGETFVATSWSDDAVVSIHLLEDDGSLSFVDSFADSETLGGVEALAVLEEDGIIRIYAGAKTGGPAGEGALSILEFEGSSLSVQQVLTNTYGLTLDPDSVDALEVINLGGERYLVASGIGNARAYMFNIETDSLSPLFGSLSRTEDFGFYFYNSVDLDFLGRNEMNGGHGYSPMLFGVSPLSQQFNVGLFGQGGSVIDGTALDDTIYSFAGGDFIRSAGGGDWVFAGDGDNIIYTQQGNDRVWTGDGDDYVRLGRGDDDIYMRAGEDEVHGGRGENGIHYDYLNGWDGEESMMSSMVELLGVSINLGKGTAKITNGDRQIITNFQHVEGSSGRDKLIGTNDDNYIFGGSGDDKIIGKGGADELEGGDGDDNIKGGGGADEIRAGSGDDVVRGQGGADLFVFFDRDVGTKEILDFEDGTDTLRLGMFGTLEELRDASKNTKKGLKITWTYDPEEFGEEPFAVEPEQGVIFVNGLALNTLDDGDVFLTGGER